MKSRTRRIIGIVLIIIGLSLIMLFNQIIQYYTLVNFIAFLLLMIGILLIFKELLLRFDRVDKISIGEDSIRWFKGFISTILTYGIAIVLILGLLKFARNSNQFIGEHFINSKTKVQKANFLGITKKPIAFSSKGVYKKFYVFEYRTNEEIIINGLNSDNKNAKQKIESQIINSENDSVKIRRVNDSILIEYSADFPTFFRIK